MGTGKRKRDARRKISVRKEFRKTCSNYTVKDSALYRYVKFCTTKKQSDKEPNEGIMYEARVATCDDVNDALFRQFHHEKGHIGQRQDKETLRQH